MVKKTRPRPRFAHLSRHGFGWRYISDDDDDVDDINGDNVSLIWIQMFPIIETLEPLFFGSFCCLGSSSIRAYATDSKTPLLDEEDDFFSSDDGDNKFEVHLV